MKKQPLIYKYKKGTGNLHGEPRGRFRLKTLALVKSNGHLINKKKITIVNALCRKKTIPDRNFQNLINENVL